MGQSRTFSLDPNQNKNPLSRTLFSSVEFRPPRLRPRQPNSRLLSYRRNISSFVSAPMRGRIPGGDPVQPEVQSGSTLPPLAPLGVTLRRPLERFAAKLGGDPRKKIRRQMPGPGGAVLGLHQFQGVAHQFFQGGCGSGIQRLELGIQLFGNRGHRRKLPSEVMAARPTSMFPSERVVGRALTGLPPNLIARLIPSRNAP
jgi:hypothetical protein